jgi:hypothetical protein
MSEERRKPLRRKAFTDRWLRTFEPLRPADPGYRKAWWDTVMPGLCIRLGQRVTFYVGKRPQHSPKFVWSRLGDYPTLSLAEARGPGRGRSSRPWPTASRFRPRPAMGCSLPMPPNSTSKSVSPANGPELKSSN